MDSYVHTTRLRYKRLAAVPGLEEVRGPSNRIDLAYDEDISQAVHDMSASDYDSEAILLSKAAKVLRRHLFEKQYHFTGSFSSDSELQSVPAALLTFQHMLLDGPGIMKENSETKSLPSQTAALTIAQLTMYNAVKHRSGNPSAVPCHIRDRESPLVIYIAIKLCTNMRKSCIVDAMHNLGLCISYKRLRTISTDLANSILRHYE